MIHRVGSFEAKTRLAELLRLAERGDEVIVMRRGQRIAVIMGATKYDEFSKEPEDDWRQAARDWLAAGPSMPSTEFRKIMADAKRGRP